MLCLLKTMYDGQPHGWIIAQDESEMFRKLESRAPFDFDIQPMVQHFYTIKDSPSVIMNGRHYEPGRYDLGSGFVLLVD